MSRNETPSTTLAGPVLPGAESKEQDRRVSQGERAEMPRPVLPAVPSESSHACDRCTRGTYGPDSNGSYWRCAYCGGSGRVKVKAGCTCGREPWVLGYDCEVCGGAV